MKSWKYYSIATLLLLAGSGCNLGTPTEATGGGTGVEGLSGTFVTPKGAPAVGAQVRVYAVPGSQAPLAKAASAGDAAADTAIATATASATGSFLFPQLADGTYNLAATFRSGDTTLSVFVRGVVVAGNTNLGTDTLRVAGGLSVQVRAGGSALPGATCVIPASPWQAVSDASGHCVLTGLPPGSFQITVSYPGLVLFVSGDLTVTSGNVSNAGTFTLPGSSPAAESFRATISMYSGVPDPAFVLPDSARAMLNQRLQALCSSPYVNDSAAGFGRPFPGNLGYRGIHVARAIGADTSSQSVSVYTGSIRILRSNPPSVCAAAMNGLAHDVYLPDSARRTELMLLGFAREAGAITSVQHDTIVAGIYRSLVPPPPPVDTAPPPAPNLIYPYTGAYFVAATPTFTWDSVPGATAYHFQMIGSNHLTIIIGEDSTLAIPSRVYGPLEYLVQYQWRVRARNGFGWGPWSSYATFMRDVMPVMPETPVLSSPAQNATGLSLTPTFVWSQLSTAQAYHLQIHTDTSFINPVRSDTIQQPLSAGTLVSRAIGPLAGNTTYYWRVRASNSLAAGTWSEVRRFRTTATGSDSLPATPVLLTPGHNDTGVSTTPTFTWGLIAAALTYQLQVYTDTTFINPVISDSVPVSAVGTFVSHTTGPLTSNATYYWRVRASNQAGTGAWSAARRFTVGTTTIPPPGDTLPSAPILTAPAQFATNVSTTPTLMWNPTSLATSYGIQVSTSATFVNLTVNDTVTTGTSRTLSPLAGNTEHYWRVRAINSVGSSAYSSTFRFATGTAP